MLKRCRRIIDRFKEELKQLAQIAGMEKKGDAAWTHRSRSDPFYYERSISRGGSESGKVEKRRTNEALHSELLASAREFLSM